jgi:hypothetical protein
VHLDGRRIAHFCTCACNSRCVFQEGAAKGACTAGFHGGISEYITSKQEAEKAAVADEAKAASARVDLRKAAAAAAVKAKAGKVAAAAHAKSKTAAAAAAAAEAAAASAPELLASEESEEDMLAAAEADVVNEEANIMVHEEAHDANGGVAEEDPFAEPVDAGADPIVEAAAAKLAADLAAADQQVAAMAAVKAQENADELNKEDPRAFEPADTREPPPEIDYRHKDLRYSQHEQDMLARKERKPRASKLAVLWYVAQSEEQVDAEMTPVMLVDWLDKYTKDFDAHAQTLRAEYAAADANGDGDLTAEEFIAYKTGTVTATTHGGQERFDWEIMDMDKDRSVSEEEYVCCQFTRATCMPPVPSYSPPVPI